MSLPPSLPNTAGSLPAGFGVKDGASAVVSESRHLLTRAADALQIGCVARRVGDTATAAMFFELARSRVQQARAG